MQGAKVQRNGDTAKKIAMIFFGVRKNNCCITEKTENTEISEKERLHCGKDRNTEIALNPWKVSI